VLVQVKNKREETIHDFITCTNTSQAATCTCNT
jgi:hypothetical protein